MIPRKDFRHSQRKKTENELIMMLTMAHLRRSAIQRDLAHYNTHYRNKRRKLF